MPPAMMGAAIAEVAQRFGASGDVMVETSVREDLARKTLNARLGNVGGLSIPGTSGIVIPYSCAAWIATIHTGRPATAGRTGIPTRQG